ncbi:hypothetical protein [Cohaesibacter intestini]|uniref:hypothetical protein n=1 Tax=Cohaesibacter intestini TaxID=2211145 RepID=UPI00130086AE|nr:hypothetical protein [Cohaesibacter intestini]
MARKSLYAFLSLAITLSVIAGPMVMLSLPSLAAQRPNPKPEKCFALAKQIGASRVWWGRHVGSRERDTMFDWGPRREYFNAIGCFKSRQDCENWLYWKRTEFYDFHAIKPCRRGL